MTRRGWLLGALLASRAATSQVIDFESGGLKYKTLTRNGVTIMYAHLPAQVRDYSIVQAAVSNGSQVPWVVRTEDFVFEKSDGTRITPSRPRSVVNELVEKAGKSDVIKLVSTYEISLYGLSRLQSTNGYEVRRQNAFAELTSSKLKAAAAASAIAFVDMKLKPGESTDGAIFYSNNGKPLGHGKLFVRAAGELFEFPSEPLAP
ncbi:MAG: hypothetical protein JNL98_22270 [Bryobacterales bacterium]|nr:hypothetical protein [Bryobacterales bacterium]